MWRLTGLIRVHLRHDDEIAGEALALRPGSPVTDVAASVHRDLAEQLEGARAWGPSARLDGQRVGRQHIVLDGDAVEIIR
jgi:uncharacterized protein